MVLTTPDAIIAKIVSTVEALTPAPVPLNNDSYRLNRAPGEPFPSWPITQGGNKMFRLFEVEQVGDVLFAAPVMGPDVAFVDVTFNIMIAYPRNPKLYGLVELNDLRDVMSRDAWQIRSALFDVGALANAAHQANEVLAARPDTTDDRIWFGQVLVTAKFFIAQ